jgi:hypothetical protein
VSSIVERMPKNGGGDTFSLCNGSCQERYDVVRHVPRRVLLLEPAMSNLCKDFLKLLSANELLVFCTVFEKCFGNSHLHCAHLCAQCQLEHESKRRMLQLPSPTTWNGAARLFVTFSMNRNAIDEIFSKARRKILTWTVPPN